MSRPRPLRSFRGQIVVLTAGITAVAMVLLTVVVQVVLARISDGDVDRVLQDRAEAVISSASGSPAGRLVVPDAQLDAGVAVYDGRGSLVAGAPPDGLGGPFADLGATDARTVRTYGGQARVLAEPFTTSGAAGVVVVSERLAPYEEAERLALIVSLVTGLLATVAAAAVAAWATRRALAPVAVMAETAAEWSEHDLSRRFDLGEPENELGALAGTLDQLLEKVASAIRSEQRLTSELAHELRTPLTTVQGMADLILLRDTLPAEARGDLEEIVAAGRRMAATITTLLDLARNEAQVMSDAHSSLREVLGDVGSQLGADPERLAVDVADLRLGVPHHLAVRAISPVVENALRFARTRVRVGAVAAAGTVDVRVDDDGPGVDPGDAERIFEPGATSAPGSGAGLGLAIARRIARTLGGDVTVAPDGGVTRFVVRLPRG
ncbi:HAMP domain-containing sensor histidine kinase [Nocardioides sp. T2.26MG-1]|uniref:HAMP domain-containing sensor histidine kinase n=1 Tax=Nocardioides sp. T2.26MG-1 TaxID=3041166 RepID=UPI002477BFC8|nr:HAMP domain-containing sensor histidine kinase [Nocardioides sp. T2.26MG-1]CAI9410218.1 Signal transduction histidine-protein kinase ArlS [Nocardioides sp. T2.26MG-1]